MWTRHIHANTAISSLSLYLLVLFFLPSKLMASYVTMGREQNTASMGRFTPFQELELRTVYCTQIGYTARQLSMPWCFGLSVLHGALRFTRPSRQLRTNHITVRVGVSGGYFHTTTFQPRKPFLAVLR